MALTAAGEALLPYARRLLRLQEEALAAVGEAGTGNALRFGITDEQALAYLPKSWSYQRQPPGCTWRSPASLSTRLVDALGPGAPRPGTDHPSPADGHRRGGGEGTAGVGGGAGSPVARQRGAAAGAQSRGLPVPRTAVSALGQAGREWRVVYVGQSATGINLAVQAGLAVTVKTPRSVPEGCRILGAADGLPELPWVAIELHRAPGIVSPEADAFSEQLLRAIGDTEGCVGWTMRCGSEPGGGRRSAFPRFQQPAHQRGVRVPVRGQIEAGRTIASRSRVAVTSRSSSPAHREVSPSGRGSGYRPEKRFPLRPARIGEDHGRAVGHRVETDVG
ncbi:MAG: hypothetical protein U5L11_04835 [Arhodomonas sp.]|nr:hypothetical protein [Arhodomonas sp.]